jgi:hypothetical protein
MSALLLGPEDWPGATKEHSQRRYVTEEQRRQASGQAQPEGLPIFVATACVARRSKIQQGYGLPKPCQMDSPNRCALTRKAVSRLAAVAILWQRTVVYL